MCGLISNARTDKFYRASFENVFMKGRREISLQARKWKISKKGITSSTASLHRRCSGSMPGRLFRCMDRGIRRRGKGKGGERFGLTENYQGINIKDRRKKTYYG
jgi:hypothetical protein